MGVERKTDNNNIISMSGSGGGSGGGGLRTRMTSSPRLRGSKLSSTPTPTLTQPSTPPPAATGEAGLEIDTKSPSTRRTLGVDQTKAAKDNEVKRAERRSVYGLSRNRLLSGDTRLLNTRNTTSAPTVTNKPKQHDTEKKLTLPSTATSTSGKVVLRQRASAAFTSASSSVPVRKSLSHTEKRKSLSNRAEGDVGSHTHKAKSITSKTGSDANNSEKRRSLSSRAEGDIESPRRLRREPVGRVRTSMTSPVAASTSTPNRTPDSKLSSRTSKAGSAAVRTGLSRGTSRQAVTTTTTTNNNPTPTSTTVTISTTISTSIVPTTTTTRKGRSSQQGGYRQRCGGILGQVSHSHTCSRA